MRRHKHRNIMKIRNMSPSIPRCLVTAEPQKLKHARGLIQKSLFSANGRSNILGNG